MLIGDDATLLFSFLAILAATGWLTVYMERKHHTNPNS